MNRDQQIQKIAEIITEMARKVQSQWGVIAPDIIGRESATALHNAGCVILPEKFKVMSDDRIMELYKQFCSAGLNGGKSLSIYIAQAQADADMRQARGE